MSKNRENFIRAGGTGNLDDGNNEPIMLPWTDSITAPATKYTLHQKEKEEKYNKNSPHKSSH